MALEDAIKAVQELVMEIPGINAAPEYPPESVNIFPFAAGFAGSGAWEFGVAGEKKGMHNIRLQVFVSRKNLPTDIEAVTPFGELVSSKLMNNLTLHGYASTFRRISYRFGPILWNDVDMVGWDFTVEDVKIRSDL